MNIDDLKSDGFKIKPGDIFEILIMQTTANSLINSEILRRVMEIKQHLVNGIRDDESIDEELNDFLKNVRNEAETSKNEWIAKLYSSDRD